LEGVKKKSGVPVGEGGSQWVPFGGGGTFGPGERGFFWGSQKGKKGQFLEMTRVLQGGTKGS